MLITEKKILKTLSEGSKKIIKFKCDYCNVEFCREFRRLKLIKGSISKKDYCRNCIKIKNFEELLINIKYKKIEDILSKLILKKELKGIYYILNLTNNKIYIGSSKDILKRWESHILEIKLKEHYVKDFNNCNLEELEFGIFQFIENDNINMIELEYEYIRKSKLITYNILKGKSTYNYQRKKYQPLKVKKITKGENNKSSKLKEVDVLEIRKLLNQNKTMTEISEIFKVSRTLISKIKNKELWSHI